MTSLKYLNHYPDHVKAQVQQLVDQDKLGTFLSKKYPSRHQYQSNRALYDYAIELKNSYMRKSSPISKVQYSDKVSAVNALGTHSRISRVQGGKLKAKKEILIDSCFKKMPEEFLRMIVVHELAHIKEMDHNKAFYQLCEYMEPNYHQYEFDLRLYLTWTDSL